MKYVSEKDIYLFVFFPEELTREKRNFIKLNSKKYAYEIELLESIKNNLNEPVGNDIFERIYKKIIEQSENDIIVLEKVAPKTDPDYLVLAAESPKNDTNFSTETFSDSNNYFLGKVITTNIENKVYVFSKVPQNDRDVKLTLLPSKDIHIVNLKDMPLILSPRQNITSIQLQIN